MSFRRPIPSRVSRTSRTRLGLFVLAVAALVLGLLSVGSTASAATSGHARASSSARSETKAQAKVRAAAKTEVAPAAKKVKTARACAAPKKGRMSCFALRRTDITEPSALKADAVTPNATPSGYGPSSLISAYKLATSGGSGQTVAIVDAYNDPNAASDLATYRSQYGLPACTVANGCFKQVNQTGGTTLPANAPASDDWAGEESLDLDMVSAACPNCHIVLVEATNDSGTGLYVAENTAASLGKYVSNSWGGSESSSDTSTDSSYFNHPGVAITVSSGDEDYGAEYPATSQYVTAVGGTSLSTSSNSRGWTEKVWNTTQGSEGTGSGCSAYDPKPSWQTVTTNCTKRAEADVASDADPATGLAVYDTFNGVGGWTVYGGTSAAAPFVAGVYALAGTPASGTYPASYPYSHPSNLFDVTTGNNGTCGNVLCTAGTGWDGPTGLGTPNGSAAFASGGGGGTGNTVTVTNPGNKTATVGTAFSLAISATDSGGAALTYSATGLPAGLSINSSTGVISGTPTAATTAGVTVTATDSTGASGSASFTITVSTAGGGGGCTSAQLLGNPGFETGSASPWTSTSGVVSANGSGETSHAGTYFAWLDGYGTTHTDTLSQSVTVPAACTGTKLTFYLHIDTAETTTTTAYDKLTVTATPSGGSATTLGTFSNLNKNSGYALETFNLGSYAGTSVTIKFSGVEDSSLQTSFVVDDTAVTTS